jgi:ABC-2 type transport system permease protein
MNKLRLNLYDIWEVLSAEVRHVFSDSTVLLIFFIAPILYPLIFCYMYQTENVQNLPVAVVDEAVCDASKRFVHKLDATPEITVAYKCCNMHEAEELLKDNEIHAIFYIPKDFSQRLATLRTAHIGVFADMSSFYYYKAALLGSNAVLIDEMHTIELERYGMEGLTGEAAKVQMQPVVYEEYSLYNPTGGYGSFFLPALMVLVIHQTLFLGICLLCGETRESRRSLMLIPARLRTRSVHRVTIGRSICYLLIYVPICVISMWLIPRGFHLPQLGNLYSILIFLLPFLLATIFFAMTVGNLFVRQKLSPMLCFAFFSLVLFFITGMVWPQPSMPRIWLWFSYIFPSTPGVQGFIKVSSMGAALADVRHEYLTLWIQAGIYFITATFSLIAIKKYKLFNAK